MGEFAHERKKVLRESFQWWRARFELVKDGSVWVIRPDIESTVGFYNPLKEGERPAKQLRRPNDTEQEWGPHVHLARVKGEEDILRFVNKWGLLGLWEIKRYSENANLAGNKGTVNHPIKDMVYSKWFLWDLPHDKKIPYKFLVCHQEPLWLVETAVEEYQTWCENLLISREEKSASNFEIPGCTPTIVNNPTTNSWELYWGINSLYEAIHLRYALELIEGNYGLRKCKRCNNHFVARLKTDVFCSERCQNNYFVSESKRKKKIAIELSKKGYTVEQIADQTGFSLDKITSWIRKF